MDGYITCLITQMKQFLYCNILDIFYETLYNGLIIISSKWKYQIKSTFCGKKIVILLNACWYNSKLHCDIVNVCVIYSISGEVFLLLSGSIMACCNRSVSYQLFGYMSVL